MSAVQGAGNVHSGAAAATGGCPFHAAADAGDVGKLRELARQTLADRSFGDDSPKRAQEVLERALRLDPTDADGDTHALLGQVHFQQEKWGDAAQHLELSLQKRPDDANVKHLLERARTNLQTGVEKAQVAPEGDRFTYERMMTPPAAFLREPDIRPLPPPDKSAKEKFGEAWRKTTGVILRPFSHGLLKFAGRGKSVPELMDTWTDGNSVLMSNLKLGHIREELNKTTLGSTRPGELVGGQQPAQVRPWWTHQVRTPGGYWLTDDPLEGAPGDFQLLGGTVADQVDRSKDPNLPSPVEVANAFLSSKGPRKYYPHLNALTIAWIQFMVHDWMDHVVSHEHGAEKIPLPEGDPRREIYGVDAISVPNNLPNPLAKPGQNVHLNRVGGAWDLNTIYGSDQETEDRVRTGADGQLLAGGKLRIDGDRLPINPHTGIEDTGFSGNWWVGLAALHTAFVKNHNYLCDELQKSYPDMTSDELFHTAKKINAAIAVKIHTSEWTPAVFLQIASGMGVNQWGLLEQKLKPFGERKVNNFWEPQDAILGGLMGGKRDNLGAPYGMSEKFDDVYRFHDGLPDALEVLPIGGESVETAIPLDATRGAAVRDLVEQHGMATLVHSLANQHMPQLTANNYPSFLRELSVDGNPMMDLAAVDILRARQRGVPTYNEFSRQMQLRPIEKFEDLGCDAETVKELERLYGKGKEGVERLDFLVGCSVSKDWPKTFPMDMRRFAPFIQTASRRIQSDPFYTDKFNARFYTERGMELVDEGTFTGVMVRAFPELEGSGFAQLNNGFEPAGTTAETHPEEHPLTSQKFERYS